jgi:hypothetical protein
MGRLGESVNQETSAGCTIRLWGLGHGVGCIMPDYLAPLSERKVAAFYRRLALSIQAKFGGESLAATLLLHWLDGGGKTKIYPAKYVRNLDEVRTYLRQTARPVFLSQRAPPKSAIGGVVPRIKGLIKSNPPGGPYPMHLEGHVETPVSIELKAAMGVKVDPGELDALYALHGFLVISDVVVSALKKPNARLYDVKFERWICRASDEYHWDPTKHMTVPNPDYGSKDKEAVAPRERDITVHHSNAIRVEKAGLAQSFHDESEPWEEKTDQTVIGPAMVSP